ncbi:hypothetical protein [Paenibacillus sp. MBLB4367]|uniref:hypothetical protein n=1 Tax=Paenibacillus sp. MBLB4367 TaxID=3384767 RepID=UPI00390812D7
MMHNSLLIRERLIQTNNSELHRSRRNPHRFIRKLNRAAGLAPGELELAGSWSVTFESGYPGLEEAADDLRDYLAQGGIAADEPADGQVILRIDGSIPAGGFRRTVEATSVRIDASDMRGIWAGVVYTERELAVRGEPVLLEGELLRQPAWRMQISQAPFGSNYLVPDLTPDYLGDDAFRLLAHYGVNGMTIYGDWLLYVKSETYPELNCPEYEQNIAVLRDAAERAMKYGVQLYYVPVSPKLAHDHPLFLRVPEARGARIHPGLKKDAKPIHNLCSSHDETLAFHGEVMANLFKEVPQLGGLGLIIGGESYYHCFMRPDRRGLPDGQRTNCPRCAAYTAEQAVNGLLKATAEAVKRHHPHAPVMAWPYSAFIWSGDPAQLGLLEEMDERVALLNTIDKDQWAQKEGYRKLIWDYSIDYTGPADNLLKQAEILNRRGMELFVKTETALGLECIQYPYFPSLGRLADKWRNVASMKPSGVLQSWMFYGMWGSRAEELGWWSAWRPDKPTEEVIAAIATRDFGDIGPQMVRVWERFSEAASRFPYIPTYFTGPEFIGPAHPLFFGGEAEKREEFQALLYYLQENEETFSKTVVEVRHSLVMEEIPYSRIRGVLKADDEEAYFTVFMNEFRQALSASKEAVYILAGIPEPADPNVRAALAEEQQLCELIYRTFLSTVNAFTFLSHKETGDTAGMLQVAESEIGNARAARRLFEQSPWLDLSLRVDGKYPSSLRMIDAKIAIMEEERERQR